MKRSRNSSYPSKSQKVSGEYNSGPSDMATVQTSTVVTKKKMTGGKKKTTKKKYTHPAFVKTPKNSQHNTWDCMFNAPISSTTPYSMFPLNAILQGVGGTDRAENSVRIHSLWLKCLCFIPPLNQEAGPVNFRVIIFVDSQSNGSGPGGAPALNLSDLLNLTANNYTTNGGNGAPETNTSNSLFAFINPTNRQRFKILKDEFLTSAPSPHVNMIADSLSTNRLWGFSKEIDYYTKLEIDTTFRASSATAPSVATNTIWCLCMSNATQTNHSANFDVRSRVTFSDLE